MNTLKLAVVGCGAQAQGGHLPATMLSERIALTALVDINLAQAHRLADQYGVPLVTSNYNDIIGKADAALIVLPNWLHAPVAVELLRQGIHVLVEKPMATSLEGCEEMIAAAATTQRKLAVGFDFRFLKTSRFVHQAIQSGLLGDLRRFDLRLGNALPTSYILKSDYLMARETAGGGALIDLGVHALDLALWWFGDYERVAYFDDSLGGVEANSLLHMRMQSGVEGTIEISRIRRLRNTCLIAGERGTLEVGLWTANGLLTLQLHGQEVGLSVEPALVKETWKEVFCLQMEDFADAIEQHREPFVSGQEGKRSLGLVEACYATRQALPQPWMLPHMQTVGAMEEP